MADDSASVFRETRHITVEWEIKKFFHLSLKEGEKLASPSFLLSNVNWCLWMYPNGDSRGSTRSCISLFLVKKTTNADEHHVSFTLGVQKTDGSVFKSIDSKEVFEGGETGWGKVLLKNSTLSSSKDVVKPDGSLTFFCTVRVLNQDGVRKDAASQTSSTKGIDPLISQFKDSYLSGRFCDVKITVGNREFQAHRMVLAARSTVFAAMFELEMAESSSGVVNIVDCDQETFECFLLFLYTGILDSVPSNNLPSLYRTADKYNVRDLKEECSLRLNNELSVDLACDAVGLAVVYSEEALLNTASKFFINNAHEILTTAKWKEFMVNNSSLANELLIKLALHKVDTKITE